MSTVVALHPHAVVALTRVKDGESSPIRRLRGVLAAFPPVMNDRDALADALAELRVERLDDLPLPGSGATLERWRALAEVAGHDLSLLKIFEGHTDALAIIAEAGAIPLPPDATWAVWAAEPPQARLTIEEGAGGAVYVSGRKSWCSGARVVSHALVTAWDRFDRQCVVAVRLAQPAVRVTNEGWAAVGMAATESVDVVFERATGRVIGAPGFYTSRPGFWHGGAGIAACWYGAAARVAATLASAVARRSDPHASAHLGRVATSLAGTRALLRQLAADIDAAPDNAHTTRVQQARAAAEASAMETLTAAGRALGAGPLCRDAAFARMAADLPVFVRQSHAERDYEAIGDAVAAEGRRQWSL